VYFNVNFNVFFKLIKVHLLVSELYSRIANVQNFVPDMPDGYSTSKILCSDYTAINNPVTTLHHSRFLLTVMYKFVVQFYTPLVTHEKETALFFESHYI
jgi:hypothetical protein